MSSAFPSGDDAGRKPWTIRRFVPGEEAALHAVYLSAVHGLASKDYTPEQIQAWAPADLDPALWSRRMNGIRPFVLEADGEIAAYADLQDSGYIDHFFVAEKFARRGVGSALMQHLLAEADRRGIAVLTSDVSRTAQPFYGRFGFAVVEQRSPELRGVVIPNALMRRSIDSLQEHTG